MVQSLRQSSWQPRAGASSPGREQAAQELVEKAKAAARERAPTGNSASDARLATMQKQMAELNSKVSRMEVQLAALCDTLLSSEKLQGLCEELTHAMEDDGTTLTTLPETQAPSAAPTPPSIRSQVDPMPHLAVASSKGLLTR